MRRFAAESVGLRIGCATSGSHRRPRAQRGAGPPAAQYDAGRRLGVTATLAGVRRSSSNPDHEIP